MSDVVIIEDDLTLGHSLAKLLTRCGYKVWHREEGKSGIRLVRKVHSANCLLILDQNLPGIPGLSVVKQLRLEQIVIPILMLTADGSIKSIVKALDAGADDYLVKPFVTAELLVRCQALLRRPNLVSDRVLNLGDLSIDAQNFIVKISQRAIPLRRQEFHLLYYLARNQGRVLSREQILQQAWQRDNDSNLNTVDVHIRALRQKLDDSRQLIKTVHGIGYKLEVK